MTTPALPVAAGTDRMLLIETFVRIVEAGSLSAAAWRLSMKPCFTLPSAFCS